MGLFGWLKKSDPEPEPEVLDEEEFLEELGDSELYVDDVPLESTVISFRPRDLRRFDTDAVLENLEALPYEFRLYYDTRRAFSRAYDSLREELSWYDSYEGGKSAESEAQYEYEDHSINIVFTMSRDSDRDPFVFTADIRVDDGDNA